MAKKIPVRKRGGVVVAHALVDDDIYEWAGKMRWHLNTDGYVKNAGLYDEDGRQHPEVLHRLVMGCKPFDGLRVDHRDHNLLDNRRANLRVGSHAENHQNRRACGDRNTSSQYRGVSWRKDREMWIAYACLNGKMNWLGFFHSELEAAHVASAWRREHMPFSVEPDLPPLPPQTLF